MCDFYINDARFFIIRHAEAQKNIEKMHGGGTQDLTARGIDQLMGTIDILKPLVKKRSVHMFHQKEGRSEKTAQIIADQLDTSTNLAEHIYGVGLGIIAELNEDELAIQYPEVSRILDSWKNNGARLDDYPDIPGREHMVDFAKRIKQGLTNLLCPETDTIIVGTTSTINMLNHLMLTNGKFIHDEYNFISFPFSGINGWQLSKNKAPAKTFSNF